MRRVRIRDRNSGRPRREAGLGRREVDGEDPIGFVAATQMEQVRSFAASDLQETLPRADPCVLKQRCLRLPDVETLRLPAKMLRVDLVPVRLLDPDELTPLQGRRIAR